jgi:hypothetical protein
MSDDVKKKRCSRCKKTIPVNCFWRDKSRVDGYRNHCKTCVSEYRKNWIGSSSYGLYLKRIIKSSEFGWVSILIGKSRERSKKKNRPCDLTIDIVKELHAKQKGLCFWLGCPLIPSPIKKFPFMPSIDKLNPTGDYVKANVVLSSYFANAGRNECDAQIFAESIRMLFGDSISPDCYKVFPERKIPKHEEELKKFNDTRGQRGRPQRRFSSEALLSFLPDKEYFGYTEGYKKIVENSECSISTAKNFMREAKSKNLIVKCEDTGKYRRNSAVHTDT